MHGMTEEEAAIVEKLVKTFGDSPFTIGLACDHASLDVDECEAAFANLCWLGVMRCPVNDGGMDLYQIALEVVGVKK